MWTFFVILVRLPITILGVLLLTFVLPIGIILSIGSLLLLLIATPLLLIRALFHNDPKSLKNLGSELIDWSPIAVFQLYFEILGNLFKWGFVLDEN
jgi:hypothetical protein